MPFRLVGHAEDRIKAIVLESARRWGAQAASRYQKLIFAAAAAVGDDDAFAGSTEVAGLGGLRTLHLRLARRLVATEDRVVDPPHLLIYRVAADGVVEVLSVVHERMLLPRVARRAVRDAG